MEEGFNEISIRAKALKEEEYEEEDVWAIIKEREELTLKVKNVQLQDSSSSASAFACRLPAAPRVVPRVKSGGQESLMVTTHQSSASVNFPGWSKNYKKIISNNEAFYDIKDDDDEEENEEMMPPHEFISRRLARSPVASYSMCEGVGRTLKGRDLRKTRNAILTKTGFLE